MSGDVNNYRTYDFTVLPATFAAGEATSGAIDLGNWSYLAFNCAAGWATWPTLSVLAATSLTSTYATVYLGTNAEATYYATKGRTVTLSTANDLKPFRYVKFRMGSVTLGVGTQAAAHTSFVIKR